MSKIGLLELTDQCIGPGGYHDVSRLSQTALYLPQIHAAAASH
jgi:hypothetical protein